jgi:NADH-quinone oxidoreductase subunit A
MPSLLLSPPAAFIILLLVILVVASLLSKLAFKPAKHSEAETKPYACGEDDYDARVQPDYSSFFPFAFFFTLAHVATLILAIIPAVSLTTLILAGIYIEGAVVALFILYRKW